MSIVSRILVFSCVCFMSLAAPGFGQNSSQELKKKVDAVIATAYQAAAAKFPCKLKTSGKAHMGRWKDVENCVNPAHDLVDWEGAASELQAIRNNGRYSAMDMVAAIENSLAAHAVPYDKVFRVRDAEALLPLSNSLLKFLPPKSLMGLPVYNKKKELLGAFSGPYAFERSGGLEASNSYRMVNFQYTDLKGDMQAPTEKFLLDSFGVPWKDAASQPGFQLPPDRLIPKH